MFNTNGFTFTELLAIVATLCLLLLATSAYILPVAERDSAQTAIEDLHVMAQLARIEALNRGRECLLELDTATNTARVFDSLDTPSRTDDRQLYEINLPARVRIDHPAAGTSQTIRVLFRSNGGVGAPSLITVSDRSTRGQIEIERSGQIRLDPT